MHSRGGNGEHRELSQRIDDGTAGDAEEDGGEDDVDVDVDVDVVSGIGSQTVIRRRDVRGPHADLPLQRSDDGEDTVVALVVAHLEELSRPWGRFESLYDGLSERAP